MKRNNIFMWAYITFILLCTLFRIVFCFSLWQPIVLAVTVSSIFFAAESFFSLQSRACNNMKGEAEKYISMIKDQMEPAFVKVKILCKNEKHLHPENQTNSLLYEKADSIESKLNGRRAKLENIIASLENSAKKYNEAENVAAFLGFLCLFLLLLIGSIMPVPQIVQEILTVFSFAIVLVSQQLDELYSKEIREIAMLSEEIICAIKELSKETEETNKVLEQIIEKKKQNVDAEECSYAD